MGGSQWAGVGCKKGKDCLVSQRAERHLTQGTHASAVRGPTPLGWLASQSRGRERARETGTECETEGEEKVSA